MNIVVEILFLLWVAINIMVLVVVAIASVDGANFSFVNPIVIYNKTKLNWLGVAVLTVIFNVLLPAISIPYWIYKIFTVGRK